MISSLNDKMTQLKRIQIQSDEEFVVDVMHKGIKMSELIVGVHELEYLAGSGKSNVKVHVINPNGFGEHEVVTTKYSSE